jgi:hypothetical protein
VPTFKLSVPSFSLTGLLGHGGSAKRVPPPEPLPALLVVEGSPDPSLASVIAAAADRLGALVCPVDRLEDLVSDPDLSAIIGVVLTRPRAPRDLVAAIRNARALTGDLPVAVLAPQPTSVSLEATHPVDPAFLAPPVTVERLLFALGSGSSVRA